MTAAELASFRALLQAQVPPSPRPDSGLFARMRARLTVVEGGACEPRPAAVSTVERREVRAAACVAGATVADHAPVAAPPPSTPPAFGRRDALGEAATPACALEPGPDARDLAALRRAAALAAEQVELCSTPDALDCGRDEECDPPPPPFIDAPAPGRIAGWSRTRPPPARRRLLGRLEAVLLAEREGLDARREADAG